MVDMIAYLFEYEASPFRAKVGGWVRGRARACEMRECKSERGGGGGGGRGKKKKKIIKRSKGVWVVV
jgi:hypothetical protein